MNSFRVSMSTRGEVRWAGSLAACSAELKDRRAGQVCSADEGNMQLESMLRCRCGPINPSV
jgi:hypothetical protein